MLPVDVPIENPPNLYTLANGLIENQPPIEGWCQNKVTHTFQLRMFEARSWPHLRELRQPVKSFKGRIQKISGRRFVVGGNEIARRNQVFIRFR